MDNLKSLAPKAPKMHRRMIIEKDGRRVCAYVKGAAPALNIYMLHYKDEDGLVWAEQTKILNPEWVKLGALVVQVVLWFLRRAKMPGYIYTLHKGERKIYQYRMYYDMNMFVAEYSTKDGEVVAREKGETEREAKKRLYDTIDALGFLY